MNRINFKALGYALVIVLFVTGTTLIAVGNTVKPSVVVKNLPTQLLPMNAGALEPTSNKSKEIVNVQVPAEQVVALVGEIGNEALSVANEITEKANNGSPVYLLISSPGGSVLDGALIINAIEAAPVPVYTVCMDLCASMAAIIHQYGSNRFMVDRSILMFHDAAGQFQGYFPHINSRFTAVDRYINRFNSYISTRTGMPFEDLAQAEHTEMWLDAEDSLARKFTDKLVYIQVMKKNKSQNLSDMLRPKVTKPLKLDNPTKAPKFFDVNWISK